MAEVDRAGPPSPQSAGPAPQRRQLYRQEGQPTVRPRSRSLGAALLELTGLHQPRVWHQSRFRSAGTAVLSAIRLRRLGAQKSRPGHSPEETGVESPDADPGQACDEARRRLGRSHLEAPTVISRVLAAIDPTLLDPSPGAVNQLTGRGAAVVTLLSAAAFHFLRLLLRDVLFDKVLTPSPQSVKKLLLKRRIIEVYMLSTLHSIGCAAFSLSRILHGRWDCPRGSEGMLCFSLGYTTYSLLTLRKQLLADPFFAVNELANLAKMLSCLRSKGVTWMVPLLMSTEVPMACLSVLRMMAEVGVSRSSFAFRFFLGAWTTSFTAIKGVALPAAIVHLIMRKAKDHPELHQPNFLPAKLALIARILLNFAWLGAAAQHWSQTPAQGASNDVALPSLGELTSGWSSAWHAFKHGFNPASVGYFLYVQSLYFVAPAALPVLVAGLRKPRYRWGAGSALAALGSLGMWPISFDRPYRTKPFKANGPSSKIRRYFNFRSVWEEPLQKDRRYMVCTLPHGVMPFASTCLQLELVEQGYCPQAVVASIILRIPLLRQACRAAGCIPALSKSVLQALAWPFPNNVTFLVPGGIAEIFLMRDDIEQVFIKSRKGFVKLALQAGVDLVPVYGLGHTQLFSTLDKSSHLGGLMMTLSRRLQISLPVAVGRFGMPLVPYKKQVIALVGKPIHVERAIPEPTPEQVDNVHAQFVMELKRVFDKHKHLIPSYADKRLYFEDEEVPTRHVQHSAASLDHLYPSTLTLPSKL